MGERRVSEAPPPPARVSEQAGAIAAGARPGLRSRTATAGAPVTTGTATPARHGPSRGAEVPPAAAEQAPGFVTTFRRMYDLYYRYGVSARPEVKAGLTRIIDNLSSSVLKRFATAGGSREQLPHYTLEGVHKAESAYNALQEMARSAERGGESERASSIRKGLAAIDRRAVVDLQKLTTEIGRAGPSVTVALTTPALTTPALTTPALTTPALTPPAVGASEQVPNLLTTNSGLRSARDRYPQRTHPELNRALKGSLANLSGVVQTRFERFGGDFGDLTESRGHGTKADQAYRLLREQAVQAGNEGKSARATEIREALTEIDGHCAKELRKLSTKHGLTGIPSVQAPAQAPAATAPTADWCEIYRQLTGIKKFLKRAGRRSDAVRFQESTKRLESQVSQRFKSHRARREELSPLGAGFLSRPEQMYGILKEMARRAEAARGAGKLPRICASMQDMDNRAREELRSLTSEFGSLEKLAEEAGLTEAQAPVTAGPQTAPATAQSTVATPLQPLEPAPGSGSAGARPRPAGSKATPSVAELIAEPPGPSSRVMPAPAPSPAVPAPEVPLARRKAIVEQFSSDEAVLVAGFAVGSSATDALGWSPGRADRVVDHLQRLNSSAATDPAAAAALSGIDWSGIEALMGIMDFAPPSPSPDI